jgi:hypothetical protein
VTGPYDDGPSGIFDHLDDPGAAAPGEDMLAAVVHRGRRIRARRQGSIAMSGAAALTAAVLGALGLAHAVNAGGHDSLSPANSATPTVSGSASATPRPHQPGVAVVAPHDRPASGPASPTMPPTPAPCGTPEPTSSPQPPADGPIVQASVPPLVPTASPDPCTSGSPSPSPSPSESASPEPTMTSEPSSSPTPEQSDPAG